ncbi:hypothetical protein B0E50_04610 [Rhodanobacter sp. C01]|nr:hypothetical protein B0E50_04610 [Rhodanobacter sp. C01]
MSDRCRPIQQADAIGNQILGTQSLQCVPIVFERNELLHGMLHGVTHQMIVRKSIRADGPVNPVTGSGRLQAG